MLRSHQKAVDAADHDNSWLSWRLLLFTMKLRMEWHLHSKAKQKDF